MQAFGRYITDEQEASLIAPLIQRGYEIQRTEHGGWGGGTEYTVRRCFTYRFIYLWRVAMLAGLVALAVAHANPYAIIALGVMLGASFLFHLVPRFSASFVRWDGEHGVWKASRGFAGRRGEFEAVAEIFSRASGLPVE